MHQIPDTVITFKQSRFVRSDALTRRVHFRNAAFVSVSSQASSKLIERPSLAEGLDSSGQLNEISDGGRGG